MATPSATSYTRQVGHRGYTIWSVAWASGTEDNFTDTVIVDLSGLAQGYTNSLKVTWVCMLASTGVGLTLEFDNTSDQLIARYPLGASSSVELDFTPLLDGGLVNVGSGGTGDVLLTTESSADGDSAYIIVEWYAD